MKTEQTQEQTEQQAIRPFHEFVQDAQGRRILRLNLHPGQRRAWASKARIVIVLAGTQSGKTIFGPHWLAREVDLRGEGDYLAVTATYDLFRLKMLPALIDVFCEIRGWKYMPGERLILSPDKKTRVILRSAEAEGGLEAATAKAAWLDECGQETFSKEAFEAVMRRLSIHMGRALLTTTPYAWNWLEALVRQAETDPEMEVIRFDSSTNPAFPKAQLDLARRTMPDWRYRMFYLGEFTRPAAAIFLDYDEKRHVVAPFIIPKEWERNVGVDFGLVNTGIVWTAKDPSSGLIYVYREMSGGGKSGSEWAKICLQYREPVMGWWGGTASENARRAEWMVGGVPMAQPLIYDVEAGISNIVAFLRQDLLRVFTTCTELRRQMISYAREVDSDGNVLERIAHKEQYHLVDALRYAMSAYPVDFVPEVPEQNVEEPSPRAFKPAVNGNILAKERVDDYD